MIEYIRGKKQYEPPRYMTVNTAIEQLLEIEHTRGECGKSPMFSFFLKLLYYSILGIGFNKLR